MKTTAWPYIILSYMSLFVYGFTDNIRGPLFPEILANYKVSDTVGSWMFAMSSLSGFAASYLARHFLRKFDRKNVLQVAAIIAILALAGMAFSRNFAFFLTFSFISGISQGILALVPNILVPLAASAERKQQFLSGLHAMYGLASFLAPLAAAAVALATPNWRWTFLLAGLGPLFLFSYSLRAKHPLFDNEDRNETPPPPAPTSHRHALPQIFLASMVSFNVAAEVLISSRLALYMRREMNYSLEAASLYVTYFFIGMLAGRLFFAAYKFSLPTRQQLSISLLSTAVLIVLGLFVHPLFLPLTGLAIAPFYPLSISFISSEFPEDLDSAISYMTAMDSFMLIVMHLTVGKLTQSFGIKQAFFSGLFFLLVSYFLTNTYAYFFHRRKVTPQA
ncbi:MFS transporter [Bdellovibrio sp. 22V]|uniref:MFS transporter n=1 Tax=Bdellovibrio TaxID=958 RepID=UPI002543C624|nr:MFS transporter [Bdellovibrio sp. 22V]WII71491.1 MFS transporter [Bdellovibrio sp. 22V]